MGREITKHMPQCDKVLQAASVWAIVPSRYAVVTVLKPSLAMIRCYVGQHLMDFGRKVGLGELVFDAA